MFRKLIIQFFIPLAIISVLTYALTASGADLSVSSLFYSAGHGWLYQYENPWLFLYRYGTWPAFALGACSAAILVAGFFNSRLYRFRKAAVFFILLLALGPGLVVNALFKDHWGRPRPRQVLVFGGSNAYQPAWKHGAIDTFRSFPSGHASSAFFLMAPYFPLRKRYRKSSLGFLCLGTCYGLLMGLARIIQGGHFLTDVLWSGSFVYLLGVILAMLLRLDEDPFPNPDARQERFVPEHQ